MKDTGLTENEIAQICRVFRKFPDVEKVVLFGSRAKGTAGVSSDIDLAVWGIDHELKIAALSLALDQLPLPYKFDVIAFSSISNPSLRQHIERVGMALYQKRETGEQRNTEQSK